eukprot:jgi/Bigna1/137279/aug1.38_g11987
MSYLILKKQKEKGSLDIMLQGIVPPKLVKAIQIRLAKFKQNFKALAPMIPMLRVEKGYWCFKSQVPAFHHGNINLTHCIPEGVGEEVGGDFKEAKLNPISSVELKPETTIPLAGVSVVENKKHKSSTHDRRGRKSPCSIEGGGGGELVEMSEGKIVFGVGWGQAPDKTAKMLGLSHNVDIDLILYVCNKYGEVIKLLSPKGERQLNKKGRAGGVNRYGGVMVSLDCREGEREWDDERFVFEPAKLPPYVHSVVICLQIQSGARSFREVFDVHLRLLDTSMAGIENEHCAFHLDPTRENLTNKGTAAIMGRLIRSSQQDGGGFAFQTLGRVCRVAEQSLKIGTYPNLPSHVVLNKFRVSIPATDAKGLTKTSKQGYTDPYLKVFIEYWVKASKLPTTAQMKGHWRKSHHGLVLKQGGRSGDVIVKHVIDDTPAKIAGFQEGDLVLKMLGRHPTNALAMTQSLDRMDHKKPVSFLVYRAPQMIHLNMRIGGPIERKRNMLWQSAVIRGVPCPKVVDFPDSKDVKVQVATMTGKMKDRNTLCFVHRFGLLVIECFDKDRLSKDDKIFRHEVDMDQLFDEDMDTDSDW